MALCPAVSRNGTRGIIHLGEEHGRSLVFERDRTVYVSLHVSASASTGRTIEAAASESVLVEEGKMKDVQVGASV